MVPELPAIPEYPDVTWSYQDGFYCLSEADVDLLLDYMENELPLYRFNMEQYKEQLQIVLDGFNE